MSTRAERKAIYNTPRWRRLRTAVLRAADGLCQRCRKRAADEVHHVQPIRAGGDPWSQSNLEALCRQCHRAEHEISPLTVARQRWRDYANQLAESENNASI